MCEIPINKMLKVLRRRREVGLQAIVLLKPSLELVDNVVRAVISTIRYQNTFSYQWSRATKGTCSSPVDPFLQYLIRVSKKIHFKADNFMFLLFFSYSFRWCQWSPLKGHVGFLPKARMTRREGNVWEGRVGIRAGTKLQGFAPPGFLVLFRRFLGKTACWYNFVNILSVKTRSLIYKLKLRITTQNTVVTGCLFT